MSEKSLNQTGRKNCASDVSFPINKNPNLAPGDDNKIVVCKNSAAPNKAPVSDNACTTGATDAVSYIKNGIRYATEPNVSEEGYVNINYCGFRDKSDRKVKNLCLDSKAGFDTAGELNCSQYHSNLDIPKFKTCATNGKKICNDGRGLLVISRGNLSDREQAQHMNVSQNEVTTQSSNDHLNAGRNIKTAAINQVKYPSRGHSTSGTTSEIKRVKTDANHVLEKAIAETNTVLKRAIAKTNSSLKKSAVEDKTVSRHYRNPSPIKAVSVRKTTGGAYASALKSNKMAKNINGRMATSSPSNKTSNIDFTTTNNINYIYSNTSSPRMPMYVTSQMPTSMSNSCIMPRRSSVAGRDSRQRSESCERSRSDTRSHPSTVTDPRKVNYLLNTNPMHSYVDGSDKRRQSSPRIAFRSTVEKDQPGKKSDGIAGRNGYQGKPLNPLNYHMNMSGPRSLDVRKSPLNDNVGSMKRFGSQTKLFDPSINRSKVANTYGNNSNSLIYNSPKLARDQSKINYADLRISTRNPVQNKVNSPVNSWKDVYAKPASKGFSERSEKVLSPLLTNCPPRNFNFLDSPSEFSPEDLENSFFSLSSPPIHFRDVWKAKACTLNVRTSGSDFSDTSSHKSCNFTLAVGSFATLPARGSRSARTPHPGDRRANNGSSVPAGSRSRSIGRNRFVQCLTSPRSDPEDSDENDSDQCYFNHKGTFFIII